MAHGKNAKEFGYMVEAGMPPMEAFQAATIVPDQILGMSDQIGSVEFVKLADIIAAEGNPLQDMSVMEEGNIYQQPE